VKNAALSGNPNPIRGRGAKKSKDFEYRHIAEKSPLSQLI
jgi:hypothetical protein